MTAAANLAAVASLEPAPVWRLFAELAAVPRASKHEDKVRAHMRRKAGELGLKLREDATGNMVIEVPATPGHEKAPITVLQGHLDMVCEKNAGTAHNFDTDPIRVTVDRDDQTGQQVVRAAGTTLGADNGIGVCMALAAATAKDVVHGPLEILCTVDEEMGMTGAKALAPDFVKGRRMINLDSEEDDALYIGCAGGCDTSLIWNLPLTPPRANSEVCRVTVGGLAGGHSGCDIHLNRGSAVKLLTHTLREGGGELQIVELRGGSKRNAIPREAFATVCGPAGTYARLASAAQRLQQEAVKINREENCFIRVERADAKEASLAAAPEAGQRLLAALAGLPHGVLAVVPEIPGFVRTSNSTSTIECERQTAASGAKDTLRVVVGCLSRSSVVPEMLTVAAGIRAIGELAGGTGESGNAYPGWQPNVESPLLAQCRRIYARLFGTEPRVTAIHAGLECGIIGERVGGNMDMISFGPHITGAHSPDERVYINSVQKSYSYLVAVLKELATP